MTRKEIGDMIRKLQEGKSVSCPECKEGTVSGKNNDRWHFACNKCDFRINMEPVKPN